jgi:hypothetical protein
MAAFGYGRWLGGARVAVGLSDLQFLGGGRGWECGGPTWLTRSPGCLLGFTVLTSCGKGRGTVAPVATADPEPEDPEVLLISVSEAIAVRDEANALVRIAERIQAPSRWMAGHLPRGLRWLAQFEWFSAIGFGVAAIQVDEYLVADICWLIGVVILIAKIVTWRGRTAKVLATVAAVVMLVGLMAWTSTKKADKAWSIVFASPSATRADGAAELELKKTVQELITSGEDVRDAFWQEYRRLETSNYYYSHFDYYRRANIERWREKASGVFQRQKVLRPEVVSYVITGSGDRISDSLVRLRELLRDWPQWRATTER